MGFVVKMTIMVFTCGCQHFSQMQTSFIGITNSVRKEKRSKKKVGKDNPSTAQCCPYFLLHLV